MDGINAYAMRQKYAIKFYKLDISVKTSARIMINDNTYGSVHKQPMGDVIHRQWRTRAKVLQSFL